MNDEQNEYWNGAIGQRWTQHQEILDRAIQPFGQAALAAAAARSGERAVDVGCGCGDTTLALADAVGPSGHVLGLDLSAPMLARARERAGTRTNVELQRADASAIALPADFDLLFSRFGVMFFEDPRAAFTNLRGGLRSNGRLAFVAWRSFAENPWVRIPVEAVHALAPSIALPFSADAPGPYAFADRDKVARILSGAGFKNVSLDRFDSEVTLGTDLESALAFALNFGPASRLIAELPPDLQVRARSDVQRAFERHCKEQGLALPGSTWIVTARA